MLKFERPKIPEKKFEPIPEESGEAKDLQELAPPRSPETEIVAPELAEVRGQAEGARDGWEERLSDQNLEASRNLIVEKAKKSGLHETSEIKSVEEAIIEALKPKNG